MLYYMILTMIFHKVVLKTVDQILGVVAGRKPFVLQQDRFNKK